MLKLQVPLQRLEMNILKAVGQTVVGTGLEKPPYEVIENNKTYEERRYEARKWVSTFTTAFYVPPAQQDSPPDPTNKDVYIEERPEMTVYASTFGGFASDETFIEEARKLAEDIKDKSFEKEFYYTVGYDSPFKLFNRKNEVWFVKTEAKESALN